MTDNPTPPPSGDEQLPQVGWWCWRGDNHGHLATQPCRSDNVPIHVPAEWADEMREVIQQIEDGDENEPAVPSVSAVDQTTRDRIRRVLAQVDGFDFDSLEPHDYQIQAAALLAVLPPPGARAAVLRDFLWRLEQSAGDAAAEKFLDDNPELRRLADEAQQPAVGARQPDTETQAVQHAPGRVVLCPDCRAKGHSVCRGPQ